MRPISYKQETGTWKGFVLGRAPRSPALFHFPTKIIIILCSLENQWSLRNNSAPEMRQRPGQHPASSSRNTHSRTSLSPSAGTKAPTQGEDGNSRLSTGFLEHRPVTSPPTNQKKVTHPAALTPNFAYKNFSPKTIGEFRFFEHQPPVLLARPCNKPFSAPNSDT